MTVSPGLDALVVGHVTLDRYGAELVPGGSAWYASAAYAALGARVRVLTAAADDFPPDALAHAEVVRLASAATSRWTNTYGPAGTRVQRVEATAAPLSPDQCPAGWRSPDLLHLAPVLAELEPAAWASATRARFVGLGVQGCVRALGPEGIVLQPRWEWRSGALDGIDAACVGDDDLVGSGDLRERLVAAIPIVAFTHGARGCEVFVRRRAAGTVGVFPTEQVDPTGAGDVFAAGFFLALARGEGPLEAARLGAAAASVVVEGRGGATLRRVGEGWARRAAVIALADGSPLPA